MKPAEKSAAAYLRAEKIYLHPDSRTVKGFWIACEPILVTSENDKGLGEKVLQILAKSTENIPDPESLASSDSWNSVKALVRAAGVRSYEAFANSAQCVGILLDDTGDAIVIARSFKAFLQHLYQSEGLFSAVNP